MLESGGESAGALLIAAGGGRAYALMRDRGPVLHKTFDHLCGIASCKGH